MISSTLHIKNFSASYNSSQILNQVDFVLQSSQMICLCGPNGCGKSTLLSCIAKVNPPSLKISNKSEILINSTPLQNFSTYDLASRIAYLQQNEYCTWNFSVLDFVLQGRFCHTKNFNYSPKDKNIALEALDILGLSDFSNKKIHEISGGEFQKIRLARALTQEPEFLLLDEPSASLDFIYEPKLMALLKDLCSTKNIGILLSIHDLNMAVRFADKLLLLSKISNNNSEQPQAIFGDSSQIFTDENLSKTFNQKFTIFEHPVLKISQIC